MLVAAAFADNVVVLTGASSGIGRAMALELADAGARLVLAARSADALAEVATACRERGAAAIAVPTDVRDEAACRALIDAAVDAFGRIDTLVANAGITMWCRFDALTTLEPLAELLRVNYLGAAYCAHAALPHLVAARGRLVAVSSLTGKTGVPMRSGYCASKHAMVGFFDALRIELGGSGVTVTMAYPDYVATPTREKALGADGRPVGKSAVREGEIMSAEASAHQILVAAARRRREVIGSARGRLGQWLKLLAPSLVDRIALRAVERGR